MKRKYAFNLGRVFTLSLAELFSVFENMKLNFRLADLYREVLIIETESELDVPQLQKRLGGTVKIMEVMDSLGRKKQLGPSLVFKDYFDTKLLKDKFLGTTHGKLQIGISLYPMAKQLPLRGEAKRIGLMIKSILTASGMSVRIVLPQREAINLPSVVVTGQRVLKKGAELDFLVGFERIYLAKTLSVQDFEDYGRRDYQRPARDQKMGMLPPKVARIMINLACVDTDRKKDPACVIADPFVGSGTVIQEAILTGYKGFGSDISETAVNAAEKNLLWIKNRYKLPPGRYELAVGDASDIADFIPENDKVRAIVSEGTLGPVYQESPTDKQVRENFKDLAKIYEKFFKNCKRVLEPNARVVMAFPAYRRDGNYSFFPGIDKIAELGYDVMEPIPSIVTEKYDFLEVTPRKSVIYDRKDQFVSREIFIFKIK